jgi:large subunit ribosomal protein L9
VVLREEVEHLGRRGEVVNVARGYARNFLLPKGLAWEATPGNLKTLALRRRAWEDQELKEKTAADGLAARLAELSLTVTHKAGETGTLYGAVTNSEIAELLAAEGIEIDRRKIRLKEPIKTVGSFEVPVRLHHEVIGIVKLAVQAEAKQEAGPEEPDFTETDSTTAIDTSADEDETGDIDEGGS